MTASTSLDIGGSGPASPAFDAPAPGVVLAIEEIETENEYLMKSYLVQRDGQALLCGFNFVAKAGMTGLFGKLTDSIGCMQAEIARSALQGAFTDV